MINAKIREKFPALARERNGKPPIYCDSACMTLRPRSVIQAITEYYTLYPACAGPGRSDHWFAQEVGERTAVGRATIADFIGASKDQVVFVRNTTEGLNMIARGLNLSQDGRNLVVTTGWEHNSNMCVWQELQKEERVQHRIIPFDRGSNTFDLVAFEQMLRQEDRLQVVSVVSTSNLNGYTLPVAEIIRLCRDQREDVVIVLDAAQTVPYQPVRVGTGEGEWDVDYLTFSLHKMCGPAGGIVYGKDLMRLKQYNVGGGTVDRVRYEREPVYKRNSVAQYEAGLQDYAAMIAGGEAVRFLLEENRLSQIKAHVACLSRYVAEELQELHSDGTIELVQPAVASGSGSILTFRAEDRIIEKAWELCNRENIMFRIGEFCVTAWFRDRTTEKKRSGLRLSFYLYNTLEECHIVSNVLRRALESCRERRGRVVVGDSTTTSCGP